VSRAARILVTGAAGFIGSTLVERLLAEGREVVGLDNFDPFYPEAQKQRNLAGALRSKSFRLERADIRDLAALGRVCAAARFDAIAHLAALAGVRPSLERPSEYADVNVRGSSAVFEAAVRHGIPRVAFASSSSVYGERRDGPFRESDPVERPISPYAATKRAGELVAHTFHHAHGLQVSCLRFFTAYGPRQRPDLAIRKFSERMLAGEPIPVFGDGSAVRDFTYVDDAVDGVVRALDRDCGFALFNLGAGRKVSVLEVVKLLEQVLGRQAKIDWLPAQTGDVPQTWADIGEARRRLGYSPSTPLERGLERFAAWLEGEA
jgi:UDP-glucuronate 4-epimerase